MVAPSSWRQHQHPGLTQNGHLAAAVIYHSAVSEMGHNGILTVKNPRRAQSSRAPTLARNSRKQGRRAPGSGAQRSAGTAGRCSTNCAQRLGKERSLPRKRPAGRERAPLREAAPASTAPDPAWLFPPACPPPRRSHARPPRPVPPLSSLPRAEAAARLLKPLQLPLSN